MPSTKLFATTVFLAATALSQTTLLAEAAGSQGVLHRPSPTRHVAAVGAATHRIARVPHIARTPQIGSAGHGVVGHVVGHGPHLVSHLPAGKAAGSVVKTRTGGFHPPAGGLEQKAKGPIASSLPDRPVPIGGAERPFPGGRAKLGKGVSFPVAGYENGLKTPAGGPGNGGAGSGAGSKGGSTGGSAGGSNGGTSGSSGAPGKPGGSGTGGSAGGGMPGSGGNPGGGKPGGGKGYPGWPGPVGGKGGPNWPGPVGGAWPGPIVIGQAPVPVVVEAPEVEPVTVVHTAPLVAAAPVAPVHHVAAAVAAPKTCIGMWSGRPAIATAVPGPQKVAGLGEVDVAADGAVTLDCSRFDPAELQVAASGQAPCLGQWTGTVTIPATPGTVLPLEAGTAVVGGDRTVVLACTASR